MSKIILGSFGGPRSLEEVPSFLRELLTDQEMMRTSLPPWLHRILFSLIAFVRVPSLVRKYRLIGGKSPIVEDTERLARSLDDEVLPFYRYLPRTHGEFLKRLAAFSRGEEITVLTLYPQYSHTTVGSVKVWFERHVPESVRSHLMWIDSYATHPAFIKGWVERIRLLLVEKEIVEEEVTLLFSAHGLPQKIVDAGDPYQKECEASVDFVSKAFPGAHSLMAYQSQMGWGRWLKPEMKRVCQMFELRKHVVIVPISFTTDHIETLYEIEHDYVPLLHARGFIPCRCPTPILDLGRIK